MRPSVRSPALNAMVESSNNIAPMMEPVFSFRNTTTFPPFSKLPAYFRLSDEEAEYWNSEPYFSATPFSLELRKRHYCFLATIVLVETTPNNRLHLTVADRDGTEGHVMFSDDYGGKAFTYSNALRLGSTLAIVDAVLRTDSEGKSFLVEVHEKMIPQVMILRTHMRELFNTEDEMFSNKFDLTHVVNILNSNADDTSNCTCRMEGFVGDRCHMKCRSCRQSALTTMMQEAMFLMDRDWEVYSGPGRWPEQFWESSKECKRPPQSPISPSIVLNSKSEPTRRHHSAEPPLSIRRAPVAAMMNTPPKTPDSLAVKQHEISDTIVVSKRSIV